MVYARSKNYIIFTHDLDFGTILAHTQSTGPSVIQVRSQSTFPEDISSKVIKTIQKYQSELKKGAIIIIDNSKERIRLLPL